MFLLYLGSERSARFPPPEFTTVGLLPDAVIRIEGGVISCVLVGLICGDARVSNDRYQAAVGW
jgi:hypothetical protein